MKNAIYVGTFDPWRWQQESILRQALTIFDKVFVMQCHNEHVEDKFFMRLPEKYGDKVECGFYKGTLTELIDGFKDFNIKAIIREAGPIFMHKIDLNVLDILDIKRLGIPLIFIASQFC